MSETLKLSSSLEDYLEVIAELSFHNGEAHSNDIAKVLRVKKPSVTSALRALAEKGLVFYQPYMPISLTEKGRSAADKIIKRHQTMKNFFIMVLGISPKKADEAACKVEHAIGDEITGRFVKFADFLEKCPRAGLDWIHKHAYSCAEHNINHERCGVCIENCYKNINQNKKEGKLMAERKSLDKLNVGESGNIVFISDSIASRKKFADLGVIKGTFLKVEKIAPLGDPIDVKIKRHHLSFRKSEAANIIIEFKK